MDVAWVGWLGLVVFFANESGAGLNSHAGKESNIPCTSKRGEILDPSVSALSDPDYKIRAEALEALVKSSDIDPVPYLIKALHDPSDWVRQQAALFLGLKY